MKLIVKRKSADEETLVALEHRGEELDWIVDFLDINPKKNRSVFNAEVNPYELINGYWNSLSLLRQDQLFNTYREIWEVFQSIYDYDGMTRALFPLVKNLIALHGVGEIKQWTDYKSGVTVPINDPKLLITYDAANASKKPLDGTYLLEDYKWLMAVSILVRAMIPIWGVYIKRIKRGSVGNNYKEYRAYLLLSDSELFEHPAMIKLRSYVRFNTKPDQMKISAMRNGLSTEEYAEWMLGMVVVRKLGCLDLCNKDLTTSGVTVLFHYVVHKLKNSDNSFGGAVNEKKFEGTHQEGENNLSNLEGYRTPVEIPQGNIMAFRVYAERTLNMAQQICPDINITQVERCVHHVRKLHGSVPTVEQRMILQLVVKKVLSPQALMLLNHETMMGIMGVVQAVLWHRGYPELAAAASAKRVYLESASGNDHRSRIQPEQLEELRRLYPFQRRLTAKPKPDQNSVAQQEIEAIEKGLSKCNWVLTLPKEWVLELNRSENNKRYEIPNNFRIRLAQLVIAIAKGEF